MEFDRCESGFMCFSSSNTVSNSSRVRSLVLLNENLKGLVLSFLVREGLGGEGGFLC